MQLAVGVIASCPGSHRGQVDDFAGDHRPTAHGTHLTWCKSGVVDAGVANRPARHGKQIGLVLMEHDILPKRERVSGRRVVPSAQINEGFCCMNEDGFVE